MWWVNRLRGGTTTRFDGGHGLDKRYLAYMSGVLDAAGVVTNDYWTLCSGAAAGTRKEWKVAVRPATHLNRDAVGN